jgi:hypothetical protein
MYDPFDTAHSNYKEPNTWRTNFSGIYLPTYTKAIEYFKQLTGKDSFWISNDAYDKLGRRLVDAFSLHIHDNTLSAEEDTLFRRIREKLQENPYYPVSVTAPISFAEWRDDQRKWRITMAPKKVTVLDKILQIMKTTYNIIS